MAGSNELCGLTVITEICKKEHIRGNAEILKQLLAEFCETSVTNLIENADVVSLGGGEFQIDVIDDPRDGYIAITEDLTFYEFDGTAWTLKFAGLGGFIEDSEKGAPGGVAELDGAGKVIASQLPSYVDDVVEVANYASLPVTGESGKIYVTTDDNLTYRWSGSAYVEISSSLALGETSSTAYRGDRGKIAYDHSQQTSGNPHNVTASQVGLGNVDNTSDADKPVSTAQQAALGLKTNHGGYAGTSQNLKDMFDSVVSGYQGSLAISDTPSTDGYYLAVETGTFVNAGNLDVELSDGINFISKDGSTYTKIVIPIDLSNYATLEDLLNGINTIDSNKLQDADYVVERVLNDGVSRTTYSPGYQQTAVPEGLELDVPASGSPGNNFFLNTRVYKEDGRCYVLNISITTDDGNESDACGLAFNDNGQYHAILIRTDGRVNVGSVGNTNDGFNFTKTDNLKTWGVGDAIKFKIFNDQLSIFINDIFYYSHQLDSHHEGDIYFAQKAFSAYVFSVDKRFTTLHPSNNYFEYDTIGNDVVDGKYGLIRYFQRISENYYVGYNIGRLKDSRDEVYADNWNIKNAILYHHNGYFLFQTDKLILSNGNSEFTLKENSNKDDFVGGNHGDEIYQEFRVYLDGVEQNLSNDITLKDCDTMELVQKSTLHTAPEGGSPDINHTVIANRIKHLEFKDSGYSIYNRIEFTVSQLIALIYHNMFCVSSDVANNLYTDFDFETYTLNNMGGQLISQPGFRRVFYQNDDNNLSAYAESKVIGDDAKDEQSELFIDDRVTDAKYYRQTKAFTPNVGQIYEAKGRIEFKKLA